MRMVVLAVWDQVRQRGESRLVGVIRVETSNQDVTLAVGSFERER